METIVSLLQRSAAAYSTRPALREKTTGLWRVVTYEDMKRTSDALASGLAAAGFSPGDTAAILAPSSPRWVEALLGILKANGVAVPVDKDLKATEVRHVLTDCEARILFTERSQLETLHEILPALPDLKMVVLLKGGHAPARLDPQIEQGIERLSRELERLFARHEVPQNEARRARDMLALLGKEMAQGPDPVMEQKAASHEGDRTIAFKALLKDDAPPDFVREGSDTALILYTSGTTGRSKGAMLSHANVVSNIEAAVSIFELNSSITTLSFLPINHVYELVCGILLPMSLGGTISFAESIKKLGQNLTEVRPSFLLGVPAVFQLLHGRIRKSIDEKRLSRWLFSLPLSRQLVSGKVRRTLGDGTIFVSGGAALDPSVAKGLAELGVPVYQGYGITETSPIVAAERPGARRFGTVGLPLPEVEVRIVDPNEEGVGEIWVRGPNVMQGYYKNARATEDVLTDGWYHTGDLGHLAADGFLSIRGRVKNLIVTPNGKNVYPEEVENELLRSPFVAEVMVYGHKISATAEEVHALIVPDPESLDEHARQAGTYPLNEGDVEALIRTEVVNAGKRLADYKRVKRFTLREEELPKTTTRKIKRFAVEAEIPAGGE